MVGSNADQNSVAPGVTLGSVVIDLPHAFLLVARDVKARTFAPRVIRLDTSSEVVRWVPNPAVAVVPPSITARIDSIRTRFARHEFTVPSGTTP